MCLDRESAAVFTGLTMILTRMMTMISTTTITGSVTGLAADSVSAAEAGSVVTVWEEATGSEAMVWEVWDMVLVSSSVMMMMIMMTKIITESLRFVSLRPMV